MSLLRIIALVGFWSLYASSASAHPGHAATEPSGLLHLLNEPEHVLFACVLLTAGVGSIAAFVRKRRASVRR